jgi:hypothetical protein
VIVCNADGMSGWVLFLGAGASVSAPTRLPAFPALAQGVLGGVGWQYRNGAWRKERFPAFGDPGRAVSPEVLFGTLQGYGVDYAQAIAGVLRTDQPNAAHRVAAAVLESAGMVWTTNVDLAVEGACAGRGMGCPPRYGRQAQAPGSRRESTEKGLPGLLPLSQAAPGGLVKFHGTADYPETLAFADRELMTPLPDADADRLAALVRGRALVLYGYAGADADLADLLDLAIERADWVAWFEPSMQARADAGSFFPAAADCFMPDFPAGTDTGKAEDTIPLTARAFLDAAENAGYGVADSDDPAFTKRQAQPTVQPVLVERVPAIVSARLVERFGLPDEQLHAVLSALRADVRSRRWRLAGAYGRWAVSRSLYGEGVVALAVRGLARYRRVLVLPGIRRVGNPLLNREYALLLTDRQWPNVGKLADWSVSHRRRPDGSRFPADYYYRAFARRYEFRPAGAAADAEAAVRGLADARDPERLAGALLESGVAALYQGQFDVALRRAFELQYRRGRYAIARWQSWGGWLEAVARCYLRDPDAAERAIARAAGRFHEENYDSALANIESAGLLVERVRRAADASRAAKALPVLPERSLTPSQRDDLDLIRGDLELARNNRDGVAAARERYQAAARRRSCPAATAMAALGMAEVTRREGNLADAAEAFLGLTLDARERGATWLEAQAVLGLHLSAPRQAASLWLDLSSRLPGATAISDLAYGEPRVLWTLSL